MGLTNAQGQVIKQVSPGEYSYIVSKSGYDPISGIFSTLNTQSVSIEISLAAQAYTDLPYDLPSINTANDYANKVYFDPDYTGIAGSPNGTETRPYNSTFNSIYQNGIPTNTAFLFRKSRNHSRMGRASGPTGGKYTDMIYNNNFIGSYGTGTKPVIDGLSVAPGSQYLTVRSVDFYTEGMVGDDAVIHINRVTSPTYIYCNNITIANCDIRGKHNATNYAEPYPYPFFGIRFYCTDFVLFNCKIHDVWQHGVIQERGTGFKCIRNYNYDVVIQDDRAKEENWPSSTSLDPWALAHNSVTSKAGWGNNYFIAGYVNTTGQYFAGNMMDRSKTRWKACFITQAGWNSGYTNVIHEYNTYIAPEASAADGVAVNWAAPQASIFRHNVLDTTNKGTTTLQWAMTGASTPGSFDDHIDQALPYGIYDNDWIRPNGSFLLTNSSSRDAKVELNNNVFDTWAEYETYLLTNSAKGTDIVNEASMLKPIRGANNVTFDPTTE